MDNCCVGRNSTTTFSLFGKIKNQRKAVFGSSSITFKKSIKMETKIKIKTEQKNLKIELEIDNSTEFKDFILITSETGVKQILQIHIDKNSNEIEINGIKLSGIILQTFKQFITQ